MKRMKRVYVHGLGQGPASWEPVIAQLGAAGDSVCPDLADMVRGTQATYANLYQAFSAFCGRFEEPVDLCGLSLGGVLALNYAIDSPERVNSLVLIAAPYKMPANLLRFQNVVFRFMPKSMFAQMGFEKADLLQLCKSMLELDFSGALNKVSCPTLILCGEKDSANKSSCADMANLIKQAEFQIIGGAGHEVNLEAPEALAEALKGFYAKKLRSG